VNNTKRTIIILSAVMVALMAALGYQYSKSDKTPAPSVKSETTSQSEQATKPQATKQEALTKNDSTPAPASKPEPAAEEPKSDPKQNKADEDKLFEILKETNAKSKDYAIAWQEALENIRAPEILDPEALTSLDIYDDQKEVIQDFVQKTKAYKEYHAKMMAELKSRIAEIDHGSPVIKGAIAANEIQGPLIAQLLSEHQESGQIMLQLLEIMKKNHGKWSYKDDKVTFEDSDAEAQFEKLGKEFVSKVMKIEELNRSIMTMGTKPNKQQ